VRGDLAAPLRSGSLDALVSNPPYLTADEYATLESSVRDWEPEVFWQLGRPPGWPIATTSLAFLQSRS